MFLLIIPTVAVNGDIPKLYNGQWIYQPVILLLYAGRGFVVGRNDPPLHWISMDNFIGVKMPEPEVNNST